MSLFDLVRKLAADIRTKNGQAITTVMLIFAAVFGFQPPVPDPNPAIAPAGGFKATGMSAAQCNACADELEAWANEHEPHGLQKIGDGVLLGKLMELLMKFLPLILKV
jgi:hypothetical protein